MSFPEKHPWMTLIIAIVGIGAVVQIAYAASPVATKLAGAPKLPPKKVA